jgi:LmbE family N-acetylglucosaminyl deacetylase
LFRVDRKFSRALSLFLIVFTLCATAQQVESRAAGVPLSQDTGAAGLRQMLVRLHTTARFMHTTAHPDDEDGGLLTLESRGKGSSTLLFTITRGEGGQNKIGGNFFDELGVLRTLELLASDEYYGTEQRFSHAADFGYSKNAAETFERWKGHDVPLGDLVRVIRTFRPDILVSRFQGSSRDGHGHHEASGILTREAFRAAADPKRFPEQIKEGLLPWQAKKLYVGNRGGEDYTVRYDTGQNDPALGMSYREFAMQGLHHQLSQGADAYHVSPGQFFTAYKLVDSVIPNTTDANGHEQDFFDGIDTTVVGLAKRLPEASRGKLTFLPPMLKDIQDGIDSARLAAAKDPQSAAEPLLKALLATNELITKLQSAELGEPAKTELLTDLATKREQLQEAARLALSMQVVARVDYNSASEIVVPGQNFTASVRVPSVAGVEITGVRLKVPEGWEAKPPMHIGDEYRFEVSVPMRAQYTAPYYHRDDPETDTIYRLDDPEYVTLPLTPAPVHVAVRYSYRGLEGTTSAVLTAITKRNDKEAIVPVAVAPAVAEVILPPTLVIPQDRQQPVEGTIRVHSNIGNLKDADLALHAESGWRVAPAEQTIAILDRGAEKTFKFNLLTGGAEEGRYQLRASLKYKGQEFDQGYSVVTREDLGTGYYYQPAFERLSVVNVKVPDNLTVGYIMGAGDNIPAVLKQVGMTVKVITPEELASGDLQHYGTIVVGIRAYDTREDVRKNNQRLLDYCSKGGTLVVQYNASVADFNAGKYAPYAAELGRERVSDENAPVEILDPGDDIFDFPNQITARDFDGWVQERGLNFMKSWESRFVPLISSQDPGEAPRKGGLLRAPYGKGTYIYTGYSFFRQLPYGVPGAVRLFVNIVSAGHEDGR